MGLFAKAGNGLRTVARKLKMPTKLLLEGILALHVGTTAAFYTNDLVTSLNPSPVRKEFQQRFGFPLKGWEWDIEQNPGNVAMITKVVDQELRENPVPLKYVRIETNNYLFKHPFEQFEILITHGNKGYYVFDRVVVKNPVDPFVLRHEIKHAKVFDLMDHDFFFKDRWELYTVDDHGKSLYANPFMGFLSELRVVSAFVRRKDVDADILKRSGFISEYATANVQEDIPDLAATVSESVDGGLRMDWYSLFSPDSSRLLGKVRLAQERGLVPEGFLEYLPLGIGYGHSWCGELSIDLEAALPLLPKIERFIAEHENSPFLPRLALARASILDIEENRASWVCRNILADYTPVIDAYKLVLRTSHSTGVQRTAIESLASIYRRELFDAPRAAIYELADNELDRLSAVDSSHSCDRVRQLLTSFGEL